MTWQILAIRKSQVLATFWHSNDNFPGGQFRSFIAKGTKLFLHRTPVGLLGELVDHYVEPSWPFVLINRHIFLTQMCSSRETNDETFEWVARYSSGFPDERMKLFFFNFNKKMFPIKYTSRLGRITSFFTEYWKLNSSSLSSSAHYSDQPLEYVEVIKVCWLLVCCHEWQIGPK